MDPKLFGKPSDFLGDRREWRHFEWVFRDSFGFLCDAAEEWLDQVATAPGELGEADPERRETDKALYMILAMVCKNEALDVVKTVTHKRGFESWRTLCKEYGSTTGTSLHKYSNLLEYDFGTTDGFKKTLLKWENQSVDFHQATGEVFSDRLKGAIVLSRSPGPIRAYLRVQNRGDYAALRVAFMNYLEAEDDGHGPVPMEVGAVKGKKGEKGKKGYGRGKYDKSFGKYDKNNEYSKNNEYGKGSEKGKEKEKTGKGKEQGKDEKPAPNSSFQGCCRSCGKWEHKASECWQGYVQAVEEVPSSSASSVAPSAATTPAAVKTASIQEINDVHEPGWIFDGDIQQRRIPSHGSRVVLLELWGSEGRLECKVKFDGRCCVPSGVIGKDD